MLTSTLSPKQRPDIPAIFGAVLLVLVVLVTAFQFGRVYQIATDFKQCRQPHSTTQKAFNYNP